jgi:uncharacterized membrane protein YecN with MAPEG domain
MKTKNNSIHNIILNSNSNKSLKTLNIELNEKIKKLTLTIQISSLFFVLLYSIFLYYILELNKKKCYCSKSWEQTYIKYFSILIIFLNLLKLFFPSNTLLIKIAGIIFFIGGIIFIISVFKYIKKLKKENCKCSQNWKKTTLNIYSWCLLIIFSFSFILPIITGFFVLFLSNKS